MDPDGPIVRLLEATLEEGALATGLQLSVAIDGSVIESRAMGETLGIPMRTDHLFKVFCATKPLLGLAVGHLIDGGRARGGTEVAVDAAGRVASIDDLLAHSAGLAAPTVIAWRITRPEERSQLALSPEGAPRFAYSELAAGLALERWIAHETGMPAARFVQDVVLDPLDLGDDLIVDPERCRTPAVLRRLSVAVAGLPTRRVPMLSERVIIDDVGPTVGGVANAEAMCRLFAAVERVLSGVTVAGLPTPSTLEAMVGRNRGVQPDTVLGRPCDFGGGFMTRLSTHHFGPTLSSAAVGHVGANGHTIGCCDPATGRAVGVYLNGSSLGLLEPDEALRSSLMQAIDEEYR